ncbi:hypothetical protein ACKWTF_013123 [Chironomus riparius]
MLLNFDQFYFITFLKSYQIPNNTIESCKRNKISHTSFSVKNQKKTVLMELSGIENYRVLFSLTSFYQKFLTTYHYLLANTRHVSSSIDGNNKKFRYRQKCRFLKPSKIK